MSGAITTVVKPSWQFRRRSRRPSRRKGLAWSGDRQALASRSSAALSPAFAISSIFPLPHLGKMVGGTQPARASAPPLPRSRPVGRITVLRDNDRDVPPLGAGVHARADRLQETNEVFATWGYAVSGLACHFKGPHHLRYARLPLTPETGVLTPRGGVSATCGGEMRALRRPSSGT